MNKFNAFMAAALVTGGLALTSCNLDNDKEDNYQTYNYPVVNLVIPSSGEPMASRGNYNLIYYTLDGTMSVQTNDLVLGYGNSSFSTSTMPYTVQGFVDSKNNYFEVTKFSGGVVNDSKMVVNGLKGYTSQLINLLNEGEPTVLGYPVQFPPALVMQYTVNQETVVKTFSGDAVYTGKTSVMTESSGASFSNDGFKYRVFIKEDMKTADVIFYSAKFAELMPRTINFVLKGLEVKYNKNGYAVQIPVGESVVPELYEGGGFTPYPSYTFSSFVLTTTSDDLTSVSINYTVDGKTPQGQTVDRFFCMFSGSYVSDGSSNQ